MLNMLLLQFSQHYSWFSFALLFTEETFSLSECMCFLFSLSGHTCHNVFPHNLDKPIPITPCLFMDETQRVVHFMLNCSFIHATIFHQAYCLTSSNFPKVRPAATKRQSTTKMTILSKYQEINTVIVAPRHSRCADTEGNK